MEMVTLSQIVDSVEYGVTASASDTPVGPKFLRITDIQDGEVDWDSVPYCTADEKKLKTARLAKGDIVFARTGATTGKSFLIDECPEDAVFASYLIRVRPSSRVLPEYLAYYFQSPPYWAQILLQATGSAQPGVNASKLKELQLPLPTLTEQRRIVEILDEAFAAIDQARANTECNKANARKLFDSSLNAIFNQKREGWIETTVGEQLTLQRGFDITKKQQNSGNIPVVSSGGIKSYHDTAMVKGPGVVIGRKGSVGSAFYIHEDFWPHDTTLWVKDFKNNVPKLVYYFFKVLKVKDLDTGAANPALNRNNVHPIPTLWPAKERQIEIVENLDTLAQECLQLETIYQQKVDALEELKQSLLHQAFTGQLTKNRPISFPIPQPKAMATDSPEFTAFVLAYGYWWHSSQGKQKTYGRVKAQKQLHFTESVAGIDLGRKPIKDAAGPNDFPHMLKAEEWAREQEYFEFVRNDSGYTFRPLANFNKCIEEALESLEPYQKELARILKIILPLKMQSVEVLATVHAAWNNLLLQGAAITDDAIVYEARDNWHPSKLNIPIQKFHDAIRQIRSEGIIPTGSGKLVAKAPGVLC